MRKIVLSIILILLLLVTLFSNLIFDQASTITTTTQFDSGDTSWMLVATALVLLMTPGLGFFYGGMVGKKM